MKRTCLIQPKHQLRSWHYLPMKFILVLKDVHLKLEIRPEILHTCRQSVKRIHIYLSTSFAIKYCGYGFQVLLQFFILKLSAWASTNKSAKGLAKESESAMAFMFFQIPNSLGLFLLPNYKLGNGSSSSSSISSLLDNWLLC